MSISLFNMKSINKFKIKHSLRGFAVNTNIDNFNDFYVELRSDVKTLPTEKMRRSVLNSRFGDDASLEDPTSNKLCQTLCDLFGKKRALFVPTGTMGNLLSLAINCPKDHCVLQGSRSHLFKVEKKGQEQMGFKPITLDELNEPSEKLTKMIEHFNLFDNKEKLKVIAFENTHNYNGGKIIDTDFISNEFIPFIKNTYHSSEIKFHLDGSRVLNAAAGSNVEPKALVFPFDTVNVCLSKTLGAPCGSVIFLNNEDDYQKAKEIRKYIGGAMRQAGFIAAPALVALEDWKERISNDIQNAKFLASELNKIKGLKVPSPDTNIVNIYLDDNYVKNESMSLLADKLVDFKVLVRPFDGNKYIRAVLHHQVTREKLIHTIESFQKCLKNFYI